MIAETRHRKCKRVWGTTLRSEFRPKLPLTLYSLMLAYELYTFNKKKGYEFIGVLPERRENPMRITKDSIMNWGKSLLGDNVDNKSMFFKQVTIDRLSGRILWVDLPFDNNRINIKKISRYSVVKEQRQRKKRLWFF
jgi:hypothetical protein